MGEVSLNTSVCYSAVCCQFCKPDKIHIMMSMLIVGWKPILYLLFSPKITLCRISPAKFGIHGQVKGWQCSGNFGRDRLILGTMGAGTSPAEQRPIFTKLATKRNSVSHRWILKVIFENFYFRGHLPPKSEIESRSNRHLTQSRLQVTGCTAERYCLLRVVVQGPGSFWGLPTFLCDVQLQSYGRRKCPIFGFWPVLPVQNA